MSNTRRAMRGQRRNDVTWLAVVAVSTVIALCPRTAGAQEEASDDTWAAPPLPQPPPERLTLDEALSRADAEAVDLVIARLQVDRTEAAERIAWAGILPLVTGSVSYSRLDESIERAGVGTVRPADSITGQLTISETLSMRAVSQIRIAESESDAARAELDDARRAAHAAIARVFFTALAAQRASELTRAQIADAVRQLRAAQLRVEAGAAIGLDAARAEVAALDAMRRAADADAALERAWDQLGEALGLDVAIEPAPSALPVVPSEEAAIERAQATRSDVRAALVRREQAGRLVDDAWYRFVPSLSLGWVGTLTAPTTIFNPDPAQWVATATLSIPFYDGGARYGALREAQAQVSQSDEFVDGLRRRVRVEIRDARRRIETAERALAIATRQAEIARRAVEQTEEGYRAGANTGLELDAARRDAEQADLQRILAELELDNARVDLLTAVGDL
ncbi:Hypothetical protein I5071_89100 [Sandaracinus amylolyticus]|nr:Hypothetical protein I5071_89100 [Sandaracinus amylolyticus]